MWGMFVGAVIFLAAGVFFNTHVNVALWSHLIAWTGFAVMTLFTIVYYLKAVMIKRIGRIDKRAVQYNVRNVMN
jgi:uncharacterized protein (DUF983 family)